MPFVFRNQRVGRRQAVGFALIGILYTLFPVLLTFDLAAHETGTAQAVLSAFTALFALGTVWFGYLVWRSLTQRAEIGDSGIAVYNLPGTRRVAWSDLAGLDVGRQVSRAGVWWFTALLLRDSDRVVRVRASFARSKVEASAFRAQVQALAPAGTALGGRPATRLLTPGPGGPAGGRYVVRRGLTKRLVVTAAGLSTQDGLLVRSVEWARVQAVQADEYVNRSGTHRCTMLSAVVDGVAVRLVATGRPSGRIGPIEERIMSYAPATLAGSGPNQR